MKTSPSEIERRVDQAVEAWERQCPQQSFGDATLERHKQELKDYYDAPGLGTCPRASAARGSRGGVKRRRPRRWQLRPAEQPEIL